MKLAWLLEWVEDGSNRMDQYRQDHKKVVKLRETNKVFEDEKKAWAESEESLKSEISVSPKPPFLLISYVLLCYQRLKTALAGAESEEGRHESRDRPTTGPVNSVIRAIHGERNVDKLCRSVLRPLNTHPHNDTGLGSLINTLSLMKQLQRLHVSCTKCNAKARHALVDLRTRSGSLGEKVAWAEDFNEADAGFTHVEKKQTEVDKLIRATEREWESVLATLGASDASYDTVVKDLANNESLLQPAEDCSRSDMTKRRWISVGDMVLCKNMVINDGSGQDHQEGGNTPTEGSVDSAHVRKKSKITM